MSIVLSFAGTHITHCCLSTNVYDITSIYLYTVYLLPQEGNQQEEGNWNCFCFFLILLLLSSVNCLGRQLLQQRTNTATLQNYATWPLILIIMSSQKKLTKLGELLGFVSWEQQRATIKIVRNASYSTFVFITLTFWLAKLQIFFPPHTSILYILFSWLTGQKVQSQIWIKYSAIRRLLPLCTHMMGAHQAKILYIGNVWLPGQVG